MAYIPDKGDLVWVNFSPQTGHEQKGRRPAVVLSFKEYNMKTGLALFCPITSHRKGYSFEVVLKNQKVKGVALSDQIRSLDWKKRKTLFIEKIDPKTLFKCINKIIDLING